MIHIEIKSKTSTFKQCFDQHRIIAGYAVAFNNIRSFFNERIKYWLLESILDPYSMTEFIPLPLKNHLTDRNELLSRQ